MSELTSSTVGKIIQFVDSGNIALHKELDETHATIVYFKHSKRSCPYTLDMGEEYVVEFNVLCTLEEVLNGNSK